MWALYVKEHRHNIHAYLVLPGLRISNCVSLIENDPVPPERHQAVRSLSLATGLAACRCCGCRKGLLAPAGVEVTRQRIVGGDNLFGRFFPQQSKYRRKPIYSQFHQGGYKSKRPKQLMTRNRGLYAGGWVFSTTKSFQRGVSRAPVLVL